MTAVSSMTGTPLTAVSSVTDPAGPRLSTKCVTERERERLTERERLWSTMLDKYDSRRLIILDVCAIIQKFLAMSIQHKEEAN